jgi:hypothetical protein
MKIRLGDLRQIIREAWGSEQLALYTWKNSPSSVKVLLYSPAELLSLDWSERHELPKDVVKGYASFHEPDEPCNGAWEVSGMAGIGLGKTLYGLGYYLTPKGRLMPDRVFSSKRARDAWTKSSGKMLGFPLDDIAAPKTPDPNDDCSVQVSTMKGGPDPVLDVAYEGPPVDPSPMMKVHDNTVTELMQILNGLGAMYADPEEVDEMLGKMLKSVSTKYFTSEFQKYYKER